MRYRRYYAAEASYFLTCNLVDRNSDLLVHEIDALRYAFRRVKRKHPFYIDAIAVFPDHFHLLCTLSENDDDFSKRIKLTKYYFSLQIPKGEHISPSRTSKKERGTAKPQKNRTVITKI